MRRYLIYLTLIAVLQLPAQAQRGKRPRPALFIATAYTLKGTTSSGLPSQPGTVAADSRVLPPGTTIQVTHAGADSGIYTVIDTGPAVKGRHIDIFLPTFGRARKFGRKLVQVTVLKWGHWAEEE